MFYLFYYIPFNQENKQTTIFFNIPQANTVKQIHTHFLKLVKYSLYVSHLISNLNFTFLKM